MAILQHADVPRWCCILLVCFLGRTSVSEVVDRCEGPEPAWQLGDHDGPVSVRDHSIDPRQHVSGLASEAWKLNLGVGTKTLLDHPVPATYVLEEFLATVWVRATRAPVKWQVRVVLPHDDGRKKAIAVWIEADQTYDRPGEWQQLTLSGLPRKLRRQIRLLRAIYGPGVTAADAYVDRVALNIYASRGTVQVWIDDLALEGNIAVPRESVADAVVLTSANSDIGPDPDLPEERGVRTHGSLWMVDGRPFFPLVVCGEEVTATPSTASWSELRPRGWNTVSLDRPPTVDDLRAATHHKLMLLAEPPDEASPIVPLKSIDPILAWRIRSRDADGPLTAKVARLRQVPLESRRPIVADRAYTGEAVRSPDAWVYRRPTWGTSFSLVRWTQELAQQTRAAMVPLPTLVSLDTAPEPETIRQARRLGYDGITPCVHAESLRQLVRWSVAAGANGLVSHITWEPGQELSREHGLNLWELINLELALAEPWLAADQARDIVKSSVSGIDYLILRTDRAIIALPLLPLNDVEYIPPTWTSESLSVVLPSSGSTSLPYQVDGNDLQPLRASHVPGGLRVELQNFSPSNLIIVTREAMVLEHLRQQLRRQSKRRIDLTALVLREELQRAEAVSHQLTASFPESQTVQRWLTIARQHQVHADELRSRGEESEAIRHLGQASAAVARTTRATWRLATESLPQRPTSPGAVCFDLLPAHLRLLERLEQADLGSNLLPGGDLESLDRIVESNWRHWQTYQDSLDVAVAIHGRSPRHGQGCLSIGARRRPALNRASDSTSSPSGGTTAERTAAWVQSPPVRPDVGGLFLIHGWIRIQQALPAPDGFMIFDSTGGPGLALRYHHEQDWQEFALYRSVEAGEPLQLTFALHGSGQVDLDEISISRVLP